MATNAPATSGAKCIAHPVRQDAWWVTPLLTVVVFVGFIVYSSWRAIEGFYQPGTEHFIQGPYVSPFYALHFVKSGWGFLASTNVSPALFVLPIPLFFRLTCYYFRKAGYRSFLADPRGCAVPEGRKKYAGETVMPWVWVNLHRITFFFAAALVFLTYKDTVEAYIFDGRFGIGVGSLLYTLEAAMVTLYTFSCHYFRHLVGGKVDCFDCPGGTVRYSLWRWVTAWNVSHMQWFWASLVSIMLIDLYIRLLAAGVIPHDPRIVF